MVVHRHDLRSTLARLCRLLTKAPEIDAVPEPAPSAPDEPAEPMPIADAAAVSAPPA
jgi:acetyl-CoA carboxylase carboxyl transferase subunit beta